MYLKIDFYSKFEVSVDQNLNGSYRGQDKEFISLLLFATYLTRMYSNFDAQPVGRILSVILRRLEYDDFQKLIDGRFGFPDVEQLGDFLLEDGIDPSVDLNVFEKMMLQTLPDLIPPRISSGKYGFHLTLSPCILNLKGFNVFNPDLNYFAFQSIFAVLHNYSQYYQKIGWPINNIGYTAKFLSSYYQQYGTANFRDAEGFALTFILGQIYNEGN